MFAVKGSARQGPCRIAGVAFGAFTAHDLPDGMEPNLQAQVTFDPPNFAFPFGTHMCAVVEVDEETGEVDLVDYIAIDDCGVQVNPLIVEGQVHGGVVQGVAQALWEEARLRRRRQPARTSVVRSTTWCPRPARSRSMKHGRPSVTPSTSNPLGVKGVGEAGTIGAAPCVMNAVVDALSGLGVDDIQMPASPLNVWNAIQAAQS